MWPEPAPRRVVIADDDERYAELIGVLLRRCRELEVIGVARDGEEAVRLACGRDADVVVMDLEMPRVDGIAATKLVREARPAMRVLMLSGADPERLEEAREAGASGYVHKADAAADLVPALLALARPRPPAEQPLARPARPR